MKNIKLFILSFSLFALNLFSLDVFAFDHSYQEWDKFLSKYTIKKDDQTLVKYSKINKEEINKVLEQFEAVKKDEFASWSRDQKLSFWINVYNAYTIQLIVKNYPLDSIKDLGSLFSSPWSKDFIPLFGKKMSLDNIEHDTIRKNFKEPRIHFAVNCASMSCPSLFRSAFTPKKLDKQLAKVENNFLNNKEKNKLKGNVLYLSKIFDWYGEDFEVYGGPQKYFEDRFEIKVSDVKYLEYDWSLNKAE